MENENIKRCVLMENFQEVKSCKVINNFVIASPDLIGSRTMWQSLF